MQDKVVAEAVRVEYSETEGRLFIVFEVKDEKYKQDIRKNWTKDIEFILVDKKLVENNE